MEPSHELYDTESGDLKRDQPDQEVGLFGEGGLSDLPELELSVDIQKLLSQSVWPTRSLNTPNPAEHVDPAQLFPDLAEGFANPGPSKVEPKQEQLSDNLDFSNGQVNLENVTVTDLQELLQIHDAMPQAPEVKINNSSVWEVEAARSDDNCMVVEDTVITIAPEEHNYYSPQSEQQAEDPVSSSSADTYQPKAKSAGKSSSRRKEYSKDSEEYRLRRQRNNIAVRKSRDKAKQRQRDTEDRVQELTEENERLTKKCDLLTKELNVLKGLFANVGAAVPSAVQKYLADHT